DRGHRRVPRLVSHARDRPLPAIPETACPHKAPVSISPPPPLLETVDSRRQAPPAAPRERTTMTITTSQLNTTTDLALVWSEADTNLWVADAGGVFGGSIDADSGRHIARDPFGRERGTFDTLEDAKRFLTS